MSSQSILVTGGTGTLGRLVVPLLQQAECDVRVLSRRPRAGAPAQVAGDLATGAGIDAALDGAEVIVHCAGGPKNDAIMTANLMREATRSGTRHVVFISVVGADRVPIESSIDRSMFGYFGAKRAAEQIVASSGLPWTTVRATQFHDLTLATAQLLAKSPVIPVPIGFRFQPVDAGEVAARLVELALGPPSGLVSDIAGPTAYEMADLIRSYLRADRRRRLIVPVRLPGAAARALRAGANLSLDRAIGRRTWEDFLTARLLAPAEPM